MRYTTTGICSALPKNKELDVGIDLPASCEKDYIIQPFSYEVIDTGIAFEFPIFTRLRRWLIRLVLGVDVTGIAALAWPRSRHDTLIMGGVTDCNYRGTIKAKIYNPTNKPIEYKRYDYIEQLVPILSLNLPLVFSKEISEDTDRGKAGGINEIR